MGPDGELGLRLRDARGKSIEGPVYARLAAAGRAADEAESDRVAYVAWTRARDRLLLGGWLGGRRGELQRVLGQLGIVGAALEPGVTDADVAGTPVRVYVHAGEDIHADAGDAGRARRGARASARGPAQPVRRRARPAPPAGGPAPPEPLAALPAAALHVPRSLSYSAFPCTTAAASPTTPSA